MADLRDSQRVIIVFAQGFLIQTPNPQRVLLAGCGGQHKSDYPL